MNVARQHKGNGQQALVYTQELSKACMVAYLTTINTSSGCSIILYIVAR